jgi:hypothetical protein
MRDPSAVTPAGCNGKELVGREVCPFGESASVLHLQFSLWEKLETKNLRMKN